MNSQGSGGGVHRQMNSRAEMGNSRAETRMRSHDSVQSRTRVSSRETSARNERSTSVTRSGHWTRSGGRQVWIAGGYSTGPSTNVTVYSGAGRGCWWYRRYDPADLPRWCGRSYGATYGYSYSTPSVSYSYGHPSYRYDATRTTSTRVNTSRFANERS